MNKSSLLLEKSQQPYLRQGQELTRKTYIPVPPKKPFRTDPASIARKANLIEKAKAARTARKVLTLGKL